MFKCSPCKPIVAVTSIVQVDSSILDSMNKENVNYQQCQTPSGKSQSRNNERERRKRERQEESKRLHEEQERRKSNREEQAKAATEEAAVRRAKEAEEQRLAVDLARMIQEEEKREAFERRQREVEQEERRYAAEKAAALAAEQRRHEDAERRKREQAESVRAMVEQEQKDLLRLQAFLESRGYGDDVNGKRRTLRKYYYPLHDAVAAHDTDMVRILIANRADVRLQSSSGKTPLERAVKYNTDGSLEKACCLLAAAEDAKLYECPFFN